MTADVISADLKNVMKRLKLSQLLDALPERLLFARQHKMPHQDFLLQVLTDEASRRDGRSAMLRAQRGHLEPDMQLERWDTTAKVTYDRELLNEIFTLRFVENHANVTLVGPVGVGKTFIAHAIGHTACRRAIPVLAVRADQMLKTLKHARLDGTHEQELRKLLSVDILIVDDFALGAMDALETRDAYDVLSERHHHASTIITSNRGPDEWIPMFADPVRAQAAIDRFHGSSYDLVMEGESYRPRLKPTLKTGQKAKH